MTKQEAYKTFRCWHCVYLDNDKGICLCGDTDSDDCPKDYTAELGGNQVSDDLISRKALMEGRVENDPVRIAAMCAPTAFDKEKVIEQIKSLSAGIILNTNICDDYAEGYVRSAKDIIEIIEKGGIE